MRTAYHEQLAEAEWSSELKIDISLSNDDGPVSACARVVTANLQAKLVNVGIHEPPD